MSFLTNLLLSFHSHNTVKTNLLWYGLRKRPNTNRPPKTLSLWQPKPGSILHLHRCVMDSWLMPYFHLPTFVFLIQITVWTINVRTFQQPHSHTVAVLPLSQRHTWFCLTSFFKLGPEKPHHLGKWKPKSWTFWWATQIKRYSFVLFRQTEVAQLAAKRDKCIFSIVHKTSCL